MLSEEYRMQINDMFERVGNLEGYLDVADKQKSLELLQKQSSEDTFWQQPQEQRTDVLKQISHLSDLIDEWKKLVDLKDNLETALELYDETQEEEFLGELNQYRTKLEEELNKLEIINLFTGANDEKNAIVTIHPGAGGTESTDWASMLYNMYLRWTNHNGYDVDIMDFLPGDEAGIKSVTFEVSGKYAYGNLKTETGVHRLVRISPFDANKRRHTSFASVFVYADIDEEIAIEINTEDLKIDTFRASGAGGQHVNTTDSAIRITHMPSGIVVQCQTERSQHKNKSSAMKILKAKLYEKQQDSLRAERDKLNSTKQEIAWGSQIRSYVLQPYQLVKDHRTGYETGNSGAVLDGKIDEFIKEALVQKICD
ncbi:MAG: peptide chain release factor 2 [SAR324 cluster bacterium]|nr:peptide chain release factor 2 [SAR324 cluster bacterium]